MSAGHEINIRFPSVYKGKQRARDEDDGMGHGGLDGILLPLQYVGTTAYDAAYSLPVLIGSQRQNISLQIDTGSSDLWIASVSCADEVCSYPGKDKLYDPTESTEAMDAQKPFEITYLEGGVSGEVYWDRVEVGGYIVSAQALAAGTSVTSEPLGPSFSGVLGLALPRNSVISSRIPPTLGNDPDGAVWASNLFSITPGPDASDGADLAPVQKFLGLTLSRPGSDKIPSLLAIGRHPPPGMLTLPESLGGSSAQLGFDKVNYHSPVDSFNTQGSDVGPYFWKVEVTGISVWVDGEEMPIQMTKTPGVSGGSGSLTAVLDSGVPVILTSRAIANGIYGALNVGPASDGNYYLPCTTPLNLTFNILTSSAQSSSSTSTLTSAKPIQTINSTPLTIPYSVHPLDLSDPSSSSSCTSLLQANDDLQRAGADMILGIPFLRGVYFVMAYQQPALNGSFPVLASVGDIVPLLGLQTLLDPNNSLDEFHRVRVLNQPIDPDSCSGGSCNGGGDKKMSVGIDVLIGLGGLIALICIAGAIFWAITRARARQRDKERGTFVGVPTQEAEGEKAAIQKGFAAIIPAWLHKSEKRGSKGEYQLAGIHDRTGTKDSGDLSEDELRRIRYEKYLAQTHDGSISTLLRPPPLALVSTKDEEYTTTMSSGKTRVAESPPRKKDGKENVEEPEWKKEQEVRIEAFAPLDNSRADEKAPFVRANATSSPPQQKDLHSLKVIPPSSSSPTTPEASATSPLEYISTPHTAVTHSIPGQQLAADNLHPSSSHRRVSSTSLLPSPSLRDRSELPSRHVASEYEPLTEFGEIAAGMAGVGTAARSKRGMGGGLEFFNIGGSASSVSPPEPASLPNRRSTDVSAASTKSRERPQVPLGPRQLTK